MREIAQERERMLNKKKRKLTSKEEELTRNSSLHASVVSALLDHSDSEGSLHESSMDDNGLENQKYGKDKKSKKKKEKKSKKSRKESKEKKRHRDEETNELKTEL
jgi:hypothetical protein